MVLRQIAIDSTVGYQESAATRQMRVEKLQRIYWSFSSKEALICAKRNSMLSCLVRNVSAKRGAPWKSAPLASVRIYLPSSPMTYLSLGTSIRSIPP